MIIKYSSSYIPPVQSPDASAWQNSYLQGTGCEMYTETLSPSLTSISFAMAAE